MLVQFTIGFALGYFFFKIFAGKYEGDKSKYSLRFSVGKYYIHLHHWFISFVLVIIFYFLNIHNFLIFGFLIGSIIQGLTYQDWYYFIYSKNTYKKIYSKFNN